MLPADQFCFYSLQLRHHSLLCPFTSHDETAVAPALPTVVREAQEREGFRLSLSPPFPRSFGMLPELDQPRLFRMQFQTELCQTLPKHCEETLSFRPAFETHYKIV